ncbi:MAG: DUF5666 domain-containing protein [Chloroflexota bacterium]|nr:DUF5666 domain-containing protein [Chloroflexota bacterium]MDQ5864774.1 DUF5666 domain-containing protein [Chloroflexota bacterium]
MTNLRAIVSLGAVLFALGVGEFLASPASAAAPAGVLAQRANPHPIHLVGKVKAVGTNTITLATPRGDVTANVGPNTWIVVRKADGPGQGTLSELKLNEPATVAGMTTNDPKVVDARVIRQGVPDDRKAPGDKRSRDNGPLGGTIKAISGSTLTVTNNRGIDVQVETTADTVVLDSGFKTASALKVGDRVQVLGLPQRVNRNARPTPDNLKINAWGVRVVREGVHLAGGRVESVSGNTLALDPLKRDSDLTISLGAATQYRALTISAADRKATLGNASQADIKAGSRIVVEGTRSADGKTLNATSVIIVPDKVDTSPQD